MILYSTNCLALSMSYNVLYCVLYCLLCCVHTILYGLEWTQVMTKYMGDLLQKMIEYYGGGQSGAVPGFLTTGSQVDIESVNRRWQYCDKLSLHMYQEGLLDRQEFLSWAIDLLESTKVSDENILRIILSLVYQVRVLLSLVYQVYVILSLVYQVDFILSLVYQIGYLVFVDHLMKFMIYV